MRKSKSIIDLYIDTFDGIFYLYYGDTIIFGENRVVPV